MKKALKLFGFIALVAIIGFSVFACGGGDDDDGGGGGSGGDGSLGNTLTITNAQVYTFEWDDDYLLAQYDKFTDTVQDLNYIYYFRNNDDNYFLTPLNLLIDGNPSVTLKNGKLNITLGKPKSSSLQNVDKSNIPPGVTISTPNVKVFIVYEIYNSDKDHVVQGQFEDNPSNNVMYYYVDKAVNITGKYTDTGENYTYIYNCAMYLKAGWNSVIITSNKTGEHTLQSTVKTGTPPADYYWVIWQR